MLKTVIRWRNRDNKGFTLVELAIVLAISGILIGVITASVKPVMQRVQMAKTDSNIEKIAKQLSVYAVRHNRLPCPASPNPSVEPFGSERGSGASGANFGDCKGKVETEGVVPYRILGLRDEDVRDGWGNYITYHVSPIFAVNPDSPITDFNQVHERCRAQDWFPDESDDYGDKSSYVAREEDFPGTSTSFTKTLDNGVTFNIQSSGQNLKWYDNHGYKGIGSGDNSNIWQETMDVTFTDADGNSQPVSDAVFVLDDVGNNIDENKSIIYQVYYTDSSGNTDYFWQETQLRIDDVHGGTGGGTPDAYGTDGKPIYRNALNSDNLGDDGLVTFEIFSENYMQADGTTPLFDSNSIQDMTLYTKTSLAQSRGYVRDSSGYPGNESSLLISKIKAGDISGGAAHYNLNPSKARFCCPIAQSTGDYSVDNDVQIKDADDEYMIDLQRSTASSYFNDVDTQASTTALNTQNIAVAYVLVSHGKNGQGAFMANGTNNRIDSGSAMIGDEEEKNADTDNEFVYKPITMQKGAEYFDDILLWRSQDQVYSETSNNSCFEP